jgi:ABC-2 type transport system permease protein
VIRAVARKDLAVLWLSPVPYVVGALLHLVLGFLYVNQLHVRAQAVIQPLFPIAGFLLLAMTPLLTMRSFAEELRTGTLDLLQAVPVRGRQLVVGKWLACWSTAVAVTTPAVLFGVLLHWWGDPDSGPMVTGFVGLALFSGALSALGVLASTLTASQPVAAMVAFFASLLLWFAHVGSETLATGVLASLSLSERLRAFAGGAVDSADAGFLVLLAAGCLVLAAAVVNGRRSE